ncbi:hypothetical protein [Candidatus Uabimicrobium sp. HlEnr_7]|uniref:hypothetical protein n=1 Tax=Candidatus Uabimicrobium helgolandensis TaxID=3095367 RepID=UPI0035564E94
MRRNGKYKTVGQGDFKLIMRSGTVVDLQDVDIVLYEEVYTDNNGRKAIHKEHLVAKRSRGRRSFLNINVIRDESYVPLDEVVDLIIKT